MACGNCHFQHAVISQVLPAWRTAIPVSSAANKQSSGAHRMTNDHLHTCHRQQVSACYHRHSANHLGSHVEASHAARLQLQQLLASWV